MQEQFKWVPFYMEFADTLKEYANNRSELIRVIQDSFRALNMELPTLEKKENPVVDIDPFTVFGLFNKGISDANRIAIASKFAEMFSLKSEIPNSFSGIPVLNPVRAVFYWLDERGENDIENLWEMFLATLNFSDNYCDKSRENFCRIYDSVTKQTGIKWNLSMGLFWIRPYSFISLDSRNKIFLNSTENPDFKNIVSGRLKKVPDSDTYLSICKSVKELLDKTNAPYSDFPSLSHYAWEYTNENADLNSDWFPSLEEYNPGFTEKDWLGLLNNKEIFDEASLNVIKLLYDIGGDATCKELSDKYGDTPQHYNSIATSLAMRIIKNTDCPNYNVGKSKYWPVLFVGKPEKNHENGTYRWKVREELKSALEIFLNEKIKVFAKYAKSDFLKDVFITETEYDKLHSLLLKKKNVILQGAPGVGKTYLAKRLAYSIIGEKNVNRICMVQFHQNYSYEDLIMGYRPSADGSFVLNHGIFYNFCERCKENPNEHYFFIIDEINRGNLSKIFGELLMLIEADKRGEEHKINLVYGGTSFYIPNNLHIIGMMNTADRSLAMIDYALRRRFSFYTMKPAFENSDNNGFGEYMKQIDCLLYHSAVSKIKELNSAIRSDSSLGKGFEIGHSYFAPENVDVIEDEWVRSVIEYEIIPLIEEYWFDDDKKVNDWTKSLYQSIGENYDG